uniref:Uncharacterized protein n=1 Tax=Ditylenchus dipsaci TaxID=166011 RepID=A0A915EIR8_9BILA
MLSKTHTEKLEETELKEEIPEDIHFEGEKHLSNVKQLTFGGQNAEGYFSFDDQSIVLQAAGVDRYGTECDQIYRADFTNGRPAPSTLLQRLSTGIGACTCSYFFPDNLHSIHASTFASQFDNITDISRTCPAKKCVSEQAKTDPLLKKLCNTSYTWDLFPGYDIYKVNQYGNFVARLTESIGYDAEGAVSPDGSKIVFTSMRSGDPELYLMDADGGNQKELVKLMVVLRAIFTLQTPKFQLTNGTLGYDGGPFFSPDGTKVIFRASRPNTPEEIKKYKQLLSYDLVDHWPWNCISNFNATGHFGAFDLYSIGEDGQGLQRVTYNQNGFDAFQ